jgi:hypothetical protein
MKNSREIIHVVALAHILDRQGFVSQADSLDAFAAGELQIYSPDAFGRSIAEIINASVRSVKPENQAKFRQSMLNKVMQLNSSELSAKNRNPGAAIGAVSAMLKNMLSGKDSLTIAAVIKAIVKNVH